MQQGVWGAKQKFLSNFFQQAGMYRAPATQDATMPADKIRVDEKVCFFYTLLQGINKKVGRRRVIAKAKYIDFLCFGVPFMMIPP